MADHDSRLVSIWSDCVTTTPVNDALLIDTEALYMKLEMYINTYDDKRTICVLFDV